MPNAVTCLRRITSQARKDSRFSSEEEGVEAQIDPSGGENGLAVLASAAEPLTAIAREDARILAELARAVEDDLAQPDLAASTERAYAHDWADFATFAGGTASRRCLLHRRRSHSI